MKTLEKREYKYYKGEANNPFEDQTKRRFWDVEQQYHVNTGQRIDTNNSFIEFFKRWIVDKAAPNSNWDIEKQGNPWLKEYYDNAPEL